MTGCSLRIVFGVLGWSGRSMCLPSTLPVICQTRNTFILKRRWPPRLAKRHGKPRLLPRNYVYDLVEDTNLRKRENLDVILTSYVQGLGERGDKVSVKHQYAYNNLLLPGLAVYASPENVAKLQEETCEGKQISKFSSPNVERTIGILSRLSLAVVMNKETEWTLQPWHVRMSFRKAGYIVPEHAIEMPKESIQGPNLDFEGKEFNISVTVNRREKVPVRCRIHHWSTQPSDRLPYVEDYWKQPPEPLFAD